MYPTCVVLQLSQLQAELEEEWKGKCERMLASAKEQHKRELAELTEQRDALQDKLTQLQEKVDGRHTRPYQPVCLTDGWLEEEFILVPLILTLASSGLHYGKTIVLFFLIFVLTCDCFICGFFYSHQFTLLKQSRESEEQSLIQHHGQIEELQALQEKVRMTNHQSACPTNSIKWSSLSL